jgi:prepilin-type N-terminal cleavage/methylation domain-containing protein/prepilin-type processing-associated H-X9-DG protein
MRHRSKYTRSRKPIHGFTLIELLVVISIITLLLSILLPALSKARAQAKAVYCLNNLRHFSIVAQMYLLDNNDAYPVGYRNFVQSGFSYEMAWDFTHIADAFGNIRTEPGMLWQSIETPEEIQQCPSYKGPANWSSDPYTGYNYNASYLAAMGIFGSPDFPDQIKATKVKVPASTAMFGEGEYANGANKFMRSPLIVIADTDLLDNWFGSRSAGTQAFRNGATNVAYADGHADRVRTRYTHTTDLTPVADGTGFLSEDNSAYDLR